MSKPEQRDDQKAGPEGLWDRIRQGWAAARERWWIRWAIDLGILALVFFAVTSYQSRNLVDSGEQLPEFVLQTAETEPTSLVDPEADRTLVFVWAPWCSVCTAQSGTVDWARSVLGDDVAVRSVAFDVSRPAQAKRSAEKKGIAPPTLIGNRRLRHNLQVDAFPTFYVLSDDRRVLSSARGYTTTLGLLWRAWF